MSTDKEQTEGEQIFELARQVHQLEAENNAILKRAIAAEEDWQLAEAEVERLRRPKDFPEVICRCGSTRFTREMLIKQWEFGKQGKMVLTWHALPSDYATDCHVADLEGVRELIDEIHKRKIDLADKVFVMNINGYIGESTRSEIEYAEKIGKPIEYLEQALKGGE